MELRDYQTEGLKALWDYFHEGNKGNPVLAWPCGTGKSIVPAFFIYWLMRLYPGCKFLVVTHVSELVKQNTEKLVRLWPTAPLGIYSSELKQRDILMPIIYGTIQSMIKVVKEFGHRDIIFIDEAHMVSDDEASMYVTFLAIMKTINPNVKIVGLSATPYRMGSGMLTEGNIFTDIVHDLTTIENFNGLIKNGYLSPLIPFPTETKLDIGSVGVTAGEFNQKQLQKAVDKQDITYKALKEAIRLGEDRATWLIFGTGIEHCNHIAEMLGTFGIECASVHSKQPNDYNDKAIKALREGKLRAAVNFGKLTTGVDIPNIDYIIDLNPTLSVPKHVQKLGRGTRPSPHTRKSNCLVSDFGSNVARIGAINDPRIPKKKKEGVGEAPVKICETQKLVKGEGCGAYNYASAKFCCNCENEFSFVSKITQKSGTNEIIKNIEPDKFELYNVDYVIYARKQKTEFSDPYIRVTYHCGMLTYLENIFPQARYRKIFVDWWRQRHPSAPPSSTDEALKHISELRKPERIKVLVNRKYPEIVQCEW